MNRRQRPAETDGAKRSGPGGKLNTDGTPDWSTFTGPGAEASAWLRGIVARRMRQVEAMQLDLDGRTTVVAPLGRPAAPGSDDDRTCDRCGHFTPVGGLFHPIVVRPVAWLILTGGLCTGCADKEVA